MHHFILFYFILSVSLFVADLIFDLKNEKAVLKQKKKKSYLGQLCNDSTLTRKNALHCQNLSRINK